MDLKLTPSSFLSFLFAYRMEIGHEEISTNHAGRKRGTPRETPTASSVVVAMFAGELRLYNQIPAEIILEMSDGAATTIIGRQIM